jgi:hypothetical protein
MRLFKKHVTDNPRRWEICKWWIIPQRDELGEETGSLYIERFFFIRTPLMQLFINFFHREDRDVHLHDHPWWFISFIFRGVYIEQMKRGSRVRRWWNVCGKHSFHKISWISPRTATLVLTGPKTKEWGFLTETGWVRWDQYLHSGHEAV